MKLWVDVVRGLARKNSLGPRVQRLHHSEASGVTMRWAGRGLSGKCALGVAALLIALVSNCKEQTDTPSQPVASGGTSALPDGGTAFPVVEASDPCDRAGLRFDGESDCNVVRCPELICECPEVKDADGVVITSAVELTLSACAPGAGCISEASCSRICDSALTLQRQACDARIQQAPTCETDDECPGGQCRQESVGSICIEAMGCSEDGNCSTGSACLFDPSSLDPQTTLPTTLGSCSAGQAGDRCYQNNDCIFGNCQGNSCSGGADSDSCQFNTNCASGFCRITDETSMTGYCTSGERGGGCTDDGDCAAGLHCLSGTCFGNGVGEACAEDAQCMSQSCIAGRCRAGEPGSLCDLNADCTTGYCVSSYCVSGDLLSPCVEGDDCQQGLTCVGGVCSDGAVGSPCSTVTDCETLACVRGSCTDGENGFECDYDTDCASSRCARPAGATVGECTNGQQGAVCMSFEDCISGDCGVQGVCN